VEPQPSPYNLLLCAAFFKHLYHLDVWFVADPRALNLSNHSQQRLKVSGVFAAESNVET
jgi:hypothetical protein